MQSQKLGRLTQYINFISGETLTYRIVPTDEESGTGYSV